MRILDFFKKNAPWVFSGIGIAISGSIFNYLKNNESKILPSVFIALTIIFITVILIEIFSFFKERSFSVFIKDKIVEFIYFILGNKRFTLKGVRKFDCHSHYENYSKVINLTKEAVCKNQGFIIDYHFNGGRLHKKVKEETYGNVCVDQEKLKTHINELNCYLHNNLIEAIKINHKYIIDYFSGRSKNMPRIVVKAFEDDKIVDIFRKHNEYYTEYPLQDNTGFKHVYKCGTSFLCNDIPAKAENDKYFNPRLSNQKVREYQAAIKAGEKTNNQEKWIDCWSANRYSDDNKEVRPSGESCYKSTLIIPMTLLNNEGLSEEFRTRFKVPHPSNDNEVGRAIYGFLCFDHRETNFFDEKLDHLVGYIFADLLSLYFIERLNYTKFSDTFKDIDLRFSEISCPNKEDLCPN